MNGRLLKAKRIERDITQKKLAGIIGCSEKTMCWKETNTSNKFTADEMLAIAKALQLTMSEFDSIFFDLELTNIIVQVTNSTSYGKSFDGERQTGA